ncbi:MULTISPECIES: Rieske (2Fe-2S) protein [Streptomyces]|uniref:Rieske (2Fe-2S) protein n=1 Tax=Streptomyces fungicidicus TaxID=68203 RepID=A0ACC7XZD3_9ACTN|nr:MULTISPECIES: Rieske (2Fe-2S) protein [Streptomyces]MBF4137667.1 Rieske (2Fe-2S) protein [Streptomyces albidoflavus]NUV74930.1 Rieske (2Fe-2S) protein [Streptomyces fungicidicus]
MDTTSGPGGGATRRCFVAAVSGAGLAGALAACGGGETGGGEEPSGGKELGPAGEIPVGGGKVFADDKVVVTQPEKGEFKAFSAVCTHAGCLVSGVKDSVITCDCHGSRFSAADGSVQAPPATKALPPVGIEVDGGRLRLT